MQLQPVEESQDISEMQLQPVMESRKTEIEVTLICTIMHFFAMIVKYIFVFYFYCRKGELYIMQSFREQSNYHGNTPTYPPDSPGTSRLEEFSPRQQTQTFQGGYGGRRSGAATPTPVAPGENSNLQNFQAYRKESGDFYYLGNKEAGTAGGQTQQRRLPGPGQSYGPPQGKSSTTSTGYNSQYGRESHHSQFAGQHSSSASLSQFSQDFPGSFSPGGGQYSTHVSSQQLRHQLYQSHQPISQAGNTAASTGTSSHLQQIQRSANLSSPSSGYSLRMGQFGQPFQSSPGSSSGSYPPQRFGQSGTNYEGYSPGGTSSPFESHMSGSSFGTQQAYSSFTSQHLKNVETAKMPQGGSQTQQQQQQQQQQNPSHLMQFSNSFQLQNQTGQYNQAEVPVRSPMQFQQNFSPISNPSPAASVVQSPSCSSTPSPLMTSGENIQCGQGNVPQQSRNRVFTMMSQLSPNTQVTSFKGYGVESPHEKRLTDPSLSSLSALSSQVANLPNTVQHMLLSDALSTHKKSGKRASRKNDSCANSETSSQAEEQLKSPMAESLDGSCSSSSGDPGERVRQLSGQSTSSEAGYKGPPSEKPPSPVHTWQNEPSVKSEVQDTDSVPEPAETYQETSKPSEKAVGVIVSMETMTNRSEIVVDEAPTVISNDDDVDEPSPELETAKVEDTKTCLNAQNGEPNMVDDSSATVVNAPLIEMDKSPVGDGFGLRETQSISRNTSSLPQQPKNSDTGTLRGQSDRKTGRNDKYPSLLQEVLQGHHQQERRYVRSAQEQPQVTESSDVPLRPNVLMSQANDQPNRSMLGKTLTPHLESSHWGQWDRKPTSSEIKQINLADYPNTRKFEGEPPAPCYEPSSGHSERRSVICDISPLRQLVRDPATSHHVASSQERSQEGRTGQSVILPSGMLSLEKSNSQSGVAKAEDTESSKMIRKRTGEQCIPHSTKESPRGNASPRSMTFDTNQDYSSHNRSANSKRGGGRVGSRGRSPAQSQDLSDKLKISPGRSRGSTEIHHMTPTMSLSERASREALYSAFFQNADNSTLAYHTNSRSSSYGEPHPSFTSPLHYKRQMYQHEEYKEWLGSSAQAILSASQHRQDLQRKSPRQESLHIRSPGRSETEGLAYSQPGSYHNPSNIDFSRQMRMSESTSSTLTAGDFKRSNQKTPPGDSTGWHLGRQSSGKKSGSPASANQKPFSPIRDPETHSIRPSEPSELSKPGCNAHHPSGPEEGSHHNPLIMRRKVRSFISPIPSKRQSADDKARPVIATSKEGSDRSLASHIRSPRGNENEFLSMTEEQSKSRPEQRSPTAVTLTSPTKTKILPPRKGRGLKLEAIVQKITSPNVRRSTASSSSESIVEPVTLDDILSLKGRPSEAGSSSMEETAERTLDRVPDNSNNDDIKIQSLSPKSFETWPANGDKQIKKEIEEQFMETKDLLQSGPLIQQASNHYLETRANSPALEQKCSLPQPQPHEISNKEKVVNVPCPVTPKQIIIPPKGYFPSGKKKGRPIGSVNKQKKQQQQLQQQLQQQQQQQNVQQQVQNQQQLQSPTTTDLAPLPSPQQTPSVLEQEVEAEPKPKRRRRERRKQPGTTRRRRGKQAAPIVAPLEPEIKLKYASQTLDKTENKPKSFFPYIHAENKEDLGLACVIINAEEEEQRWRKVRKDQKSTSPQPSESKALPVSSFMVQGPAVTESASVGHLVCCFCGKWANYKNLGDLFGPFYTQEYASTLSKNPPPKKLSETPQKVKVRHKDALDGSKSDSDEEEEEPEQAREQRSLSAHPRYKRRNRSGDCTSSRHAVPSRRNTTDSNELVSLDSSGSVNADGVPDQGFQIPQLPLDSNEFWMHEACVLWANGVYFVCGRLYGLQEACDVAREMVSDLKKSLLFTASTLFFCLQNPSGFNKNLVKIKLKTKTERKHMLFRTRKPSCFLPDKAPLLSSVCARCWSSILLK